MFCTGIYRPELIEEILVKRMGVDRDQVKRLEISPDRQWLQAVLWDNSLRVIPRQQAESFTRLGCGSCDDYLGESADLALGALGVSAGYSTLLVRSRIGDIFVRNAVQMNLLETTQEVDETALGIAAAEKDRRERAQVFKDLQVLMLDALLRSAQTQRSHRTVCPPLPYPAAQRGGRPPAQRLHRLLSRYPVR